MVMCFGVGVCICIVVGLVGVILLVLIIGVVLFIWLVGVLFYLDRRLLFGVGVVFGVFVLVRLVLGVFV